MANFFLKTVHPHVVLSVCIEKKMSGESDQETTTTELKRKIRDAFDIFDHESNKTVDVREIGTIVRSLNCCPSEAELGDILNDIEEDEPTGW